MIATRDRNRCLPERIALLGCGNVGREVARQLLSFTGVELVGVLVRDEVRDRGVPAELIVTEIDEIFKRGPALVIECIGGLGPAQVFVRRALERSISVVTANKTLIAHHGRELLAIGASSSARLAFEASVCAGVPVLGALRQLRGDRVRSIQGVVNGTCNAVLTRMESGRTLAEAVAEAQRLGLAEADPSADLSGRDSAEKLCILAAAAGLGRLLPQQIDCRGIEEIAPEDLADARASRRVIRLVAEIAEGGRCRVGPALLGRDHPLALLRGAENGVVLTTELAGELFFRGQGAGPGPTASAILSDVARLLQCRLRPGVIRPEVPQPRSHYVRIAGTRVDPEPVLASLAHHHAGASELALERRRVSALVSLDEPSARACAFDVAQEGGRALVMPLL